MTSYARILEGVEEHQTLSQYHEIIREAGTSLPAPSRAQINAFIDTMIAKIETSDDFTTARKRSLRNRLDQAREAAIDPEMFYASQRIEERARIAKVALDDYYARTARSLGESIAHVRARLSASYEESRRERTTAAPEDWITEFRDRPENRGIPLDRHTTYAMWRIDNEIATLGERVTSRPTVATHQRVHGTGLSAIGYDPETGRLECEFRSRQGQFQSYRNVPASVASALMSAHDPTPIFNRLVRGNPNYAYPSQAEADAAGTVRRCGSCGQFASTSHGCPPQGSSEEVAATSERARIQQRVLRAREAVASGSREDRVERYRTEQGLTVDDAQQRVAFEDRLAQLSPDTAMRHRQNQRLDARIHPYRGESGVFRCTALSTVRRIVQEEGAANVPVTARIHRVCDDTGTPRTVEPGVVSGRVIVTRASDGVYQVEAVTVPGDSGDDQLRCTCLDYRRDYDCAHLRQHLSDMTRRINQDDLRRRHAISDAVAQVNAEAALDHALSVEGQVGRLAAWRSRADGINYSGEAGAVIFQQDYEAAKVRYQRGQDPIGYMRNNVMDGLADRGTGRGMGIEMEFKFPDTMPYPSRAAALTAIGKDLYDAGLTPVPEQEPYHSAAERGYRDTHARGWSFEEDGSVDGEIVSPVMYDEPATWDNIVTVCAILKRHGAVASVKTGCHVHVSTGDYDHTVANSNRLLGLYHENEDALMRLASRPAEVGPTGGTLPHDHRLVRGNHYAAPNRRASRGYTTVQRAASANWGHCAINLEDTSHGATSDHVEFRLWDGTLNPSVIQAQMKVSVAMVEAAYRETEYRPTAHIPMGTTRQAHRAIHGPRPRLTTDQWRASTEGVRQLADTLFRRHEDKAQFAALFAMTKWQMRPPPLPVQMPVPVPAP